MTAARSAAFPLSAPGSIPSCPAASRRWALVLGPLLAVAVAAAACEPPAPPELPGEGEPTVQEPAAAAEAMAETAECENEADGYTVRYPATWEVNAGDVLEPCSLFDPEPIRVPPASEIPLEIAVILGVEPVPFETLSGEVLGRRDLSREAATVDGRSAMRIEAETTGEGLHEAGIRFYQVVVDLDGRTFVATTYGTGSLALDVKQAIVDRMLDTVRFHGWERPVVR